MTDENFGVPYMVGWGARKLWEVLGKTGLDWAAALPGEREKYRYAAYMMLREVRDPAQGFTRMVEAAKASQRQCSTCASDAWRAMVDEMLTYRMEDGSARKWR
jgi:hypothetical protein